MKTAATNKKVRELITLVRDGKLVPRPEFQRRLVWTIKDKNHFLDSILQGYPFPEIYVADGDVDLETGDGSQLLVDGLQRVSTLVQYFEADPDLKLMSVPNYKDLDKDQKQAFLQYDVTVRDLGAIEKGQIIEVFKRINSTKYGLTDIEVNNAVYSGVFRHYAEQVSLRPFFTEHNVFSSLDYKRMGDLRFAVLLISTLIAGYFNRDDLFEKMLDRYNDQFDLQPEIDNRLDRIFDFIEECGFIPKSRAWRKTDLFTLIVELNTALIDDKIDLDPLYVVTRIQEFYGTLETAELSNITIAGIYYKATLQASNDRINRARRGEIISGLLRRDNEEQILTSLLEREII